MVGNLVGAVTARCRTELGDLVWLRTWPDQTPARPPSGDFGACQAVL